MITREELLDQLDQAHAAATPGPWENPYPFTKLIDAPGSTDNLAIVQCDSAADAALIVAAVNALPKLTAALRAVEALAEQWARLEHWDYKGPEKLARARADSANDAARILRDALTAALTSEVVP